MKGFYIKKSLPECAQEWDRLLYALEHETDLLVLSPIRERISMETVYQDLHELHIAQRPHLPSNSRWNGANDFACRAAQEAAYDSFISSFTVIERPLLQTFRSLDETADDDRDVMEIDFESQPFSQSILPSPRTTPSVRSASGTTPMPSTPNVGASHALERLSALAIQCRNPKVVPESRLLSRWKLGEDPSNYTWNRPDEEEEWLVSYKAKKAREAERKKRKVDKYRALGIWGKDADDGGPSSSIEFGRQRSAGPSRGPGRQQQPELSTPLKASSQTPTSRQAGGQASLPLPPAEPMSSQLHAREGSSLSRPKLAESLAGVSLSQPVAGSFAGPLGSARKAKVKKRKKGF